MHMLQEISAVELEERLATGQFSLLLDVRTREEYDSGHIAGAVNLPLNTDLSSTVRSGSLDEFRDRPVAVICGTSTRSGQATVRLTKVFGFSNVVNVTGGMQAWERGGLPVQRPVRSGGSCGCGSSGGGGGGCKK
jgi:rhodanese-related sulfurtransferase